MRLNVRRRDRENNKSYRGEQMSNRGSKKDKEAKLTARVEQQVGGTSQTASFTRFSSRRRAETDLTPVLRLVSDGTLDHLRRLSGVFSDSPASQTEAEITRESSGLKVSDTSAISRSFFGFDATLKRSFFMLDCLLVGTRVPTGRNQNRGWISRRNRGSSSREGRDQAELMRRQKRRREKMLIVLIKMLIL